MLRVVLCHTDLRIYWPPRIIALAHYLNARNAQLHVIEISGQGSPYAFAEESYQDTNTVPWICLFPKERMEDLCSKYVSKRLYQELDTQKPDILIAGAVAFPSGATAVRWARERKVPVIIMDNARLKDVPRSGFVNWIKRRVYANVDAILLPAESHIPDYRFWGIPERSMFFGVNVVDNDYFVKHARCFLSKDQDIRNQFDLPQHYFLGVGRQIPKKNWHTLIQAFCRATGQVTNDWGLVLIGEGPEAPKLMDLAKETRAKIIFLPFQDQESLCQFYATAECLVLLSSVGETWGLVVNEAMASGLPVIVSKECGCAETLVLDGHNGWQCNPHSPDEVAVILRRFMDLSAADRRRMGVHSAQIVSNWGMDRFCDGVWQAVQYCTQIPPHGYNAPVIDRAILNLWNGRYRPV